MITHHRHMRLRRCMLGRSMLLSSTERSVRSLHRKLSEAIALCRSCIYDRAMLLIRGCSTVIAVDIILICVASLSFARILISKQENKILFREQLLRSLCALRHEIKTTHNQLSDGYVPISVPGTLAWYCVVWYCQVDFNHSCNSFCISVWQS